jgi:cation:H+ antiporter
MIQQFLIFFGALAVLLLSARFFTGSAEQIGEWLQLPAFVVGIFIVGIGTSLPELIAGIISVQKGVSEILPGNVIGANISNILLITGMAAVLNRKTITLSSGYIYVDLHFLVGSFFYFVLVAYDGVIRPLEASVGLIMFLVYSIYLIRGETAGTNKRNQEVRSEFPLKAAAVLLLSGVGIYFGAEYTIGALEKIAQSIGVPQSVIALTLLSLGTTLPELAVIVSAVRQGKVEMAIGNVLGSCIFNTLAIASIASFVGNITVPSELLQLSLPVMAACGLLFYLLTQDKRISVWEGLMFVSLYLLFILQVIQR